MGGDPMSAFDPKRTLAIQFFCDAQHRLAISVGSLTFSLVDYPNPCHPDDVQQGPAGEPDASSPGIGADGATTPGNSQAPGPLGSDDLERDALASTEGDIHAARRGLISQVPRQMGAHWSASADPAHADHGAPSWHTLPLLAPA
jgi:hypothetical protein